MAKNKKRALTAAILVAGLVVILGGGLTASNMGFKLNRALVAAGPQSLTGFNTIGLPYNRQVGIDNASDLFGDIGYVNVSQIQKFVPNGDSFTGYALGSPDFALNAGEGYFVQMSQDLNYIVVGSHDPGAQIPLEAAGVTSTSGLNFYAPPYHATSSTASELFAELGYLNVAQIQRFDSAPAGDSFASYGLGSPDFPLNPGEAYFVQMSQSLNFTPSHY
jgi:hypothetical protein